MKNHCHFIINKPYGFLSQFVNNQTKRKKPLLGELHDFPEGTMAIGRLDAKSEGLLFLTTDGKVSNFITSNKVEKEYYVQVNGLITDEALEKMRNGIEIGLHGEKYITKPCKVKSIEDPKFIERSKKIRDDKHGPTSWISVTLKEGKFRQVRKMTSAVGFPTLRLVRVRIDLEYLGDLKPGEVKKVSEFKTYNKTP